MARANPRVTLDAILNSPDYDTALTKLTAALRRTWAAGSQAGWHDGVADATHDTEDDRTDTPNPYSGGSR